MSFDPDTTGPSKSGRQADAMQHAAHNAEYATRRGIPQEVAQAFHAADIREGLWGKYKGCWCPKCE